MQKILGLLFLLLQIYTINAQTDFSKSWKDLFSYNHITDFTQTETEIIALTDNALFVFDKSTGESKKISSINGLSGETTSAFYYDKDTGKIIIGYKNGLIEIVNNDYKITTKLDIKNFDIVGSKQVNHITAHGNTLFISLPFGILTLDIKTNNFGDTYFIGDNSSEVNVNEIAIFDNKIYAITQNGLYIAPLDHPFLVDFNNWTRVQENNFSNITLFNDEILLSDAMTLYKLLADSSLSIVGLQAQTIKDLQVNDAFLCVVTEGSVSIYNSSFTLHNQSISEETDTYTYQANTAQVFNDKLYIGTTDYGVLQSDFSSIEDFTEIHPKGPLSNQIFSISTLNDDIWVVFGGYDEGYEKMYNQKGVSHFNGEKWINIPYGDDSITKQDLVFVSIDPYHENRVYVSSYGQGMIVIEDDLVTAHWDDTNTPLEKGLTWDVILIGDTIFDKDGNLWITNMLTDNVLKKYSVTGDWSSYNLTSLREGHHGMREFVIDGYDNLWMGNVNDGVWAVNSSVTKKIALKTNPSKGNLPHNDVRGLAVDDNNTIWIGTRDGLVTFNASPSFFEQATYSAAPVVIASGEDDGFGVALLGTQRINAICVDGANNKWFGTNAGGVLYTNPTGKETILHFDKSNSPLPSNKILKIDFNEKTGLVYFTTDKGIVAYDSNIVPYAAHLIDAYAYPNPVLKNHEFVTIDGRNGNHLPNGTNVKILDTAGHLVFETNVVSGQEQYGGKVTWNKTNLAGNKVASGVYVVLLATDDAKETTMTKIAIIN